MDFTSMKPKQSFALRLAQSGLSAKEIAAAVGVPYNTAWAWLRGTRVPRSFYQSEILRRMEATGVAYRYRGFRITERGKSRWVTEDGDGGFFGEFKTLADAKRVIDNLLRVQT